ncbi:MAG: ankyrin repeat domain-containing protein [Alphaproteobacteria bacterium]
MTQDFNSVATEIPLHVQLFKAAIRGDLAETKRLIEAGAEIESRNTSGHTPLMLAAAGGHVDVAAALLDARADVNALCKTGASALAVTVGQADRAMADLLMSRGADPLAGHADNRKNLLRAAVGWGQEDLFNTLVAAGTDFRFEDDGGRTLVMLACSSDQPRMLELLIAAGMDVSEKAKRIDEAADRAADEGSHGCLRILLDHGISPDGEGRGSLLYRAARKGAEKAVALLLERGAAPNDADDFSDAPLRIAITGGHTGCVDLLLKHGADPLKLAWDGKEKITDEQAAQKAGGEIEKLVTAAARKFHLIVAAGANDTSLMKTLLDEGAPIETVDRFGATALLEAVKQRHVDAVRFLLEHHANVNYKSPGEYGYTPLYAAVMKMQRYSATVDPDAAIMDLLFAQGADPNVLNYRKTLLWFVAGGKQQDTMATLIAHGADPNIPNADGQQTPLFAAVVNNAPEVVDKLIKAGAQVDVLDEDRLVSLWYAVLGKQHKNAALLLAHKADPNIRNGADERTPLYAAVLNKDVEMVNRLVEAGARIEVKDKDGVTLRSVAEGTGDRALIAAIREFYEREMEQIGDDATRLSSTVSVFKPFRFKPGVK